MNLAFSNPFSDLTVLVVDDQRDMRVMLCDMLKLMGIPMVFDAANGQAALEYLATASYRTDVIVCDWNMPDMSGLEVLRRVRETDPHVAFLMITGRGDIESVIQAKRAGVTGYIRKPFSAADLEMRVRNAAQRRAAA